MNKNILKYIASIALFGLLFSCKKDETKVIMSTVNVPTIQTMPALTLTRATGTQTLTFVGTPVDPGFQASATYFLEACVKGTNFIDPISIFSGVSDASMQITVSDLNVILLKKLAADQVSAVDFRVRAVMTLSAGTGYTPMVYNSPTTTVNVTPYGLPRLDLIGSGVTQKIESALGNGSYTGYVKLDATKPFTLKDPDAGTVYGNTGGALATNGASFTAAASGWYKVSANVTAHTYTIDPYMIGLVGDATPNGWNSPDQKLDYNAATGTWSITVTLIDGTFKFRKNDGWAWNLGYNSDNSSLVYNGSNVSTTAGNYTISLTITSDALQTGTFKAIKN
jgi:starch-binding outer membrane protein SusE/F